MTPLLLILAGLALRGIAAGRRGGTSGLGRITEKEAKRIKAAQEKACGKWTPGMVYCVGGKWSAEWPKDAGAMLTQADKDLMSMAQKAANTGVEMVLPGQTGAATAEDSFVVTGDPLMPYTDVRAKELERSQAAVQQAVVVAEETRTGLKRAAQNAYSQYLWRVNATGGKGEALALIEFEQKLRDINTALDNANMLIGGAYAQYQSIANSMPGNPELPSPVAPTLPAITVSELTPILPGAGAESQSAQTALENANQVVAAIIPVIDAGTQDIAKALPAAASAPIGGVSESYAKRFVADIKTLIDRYDALYGKGWRTNALGIRPEQENAMVSDNPISDAQYNQAIKPMNAFMADMVGLGIKYYGKLGGPQSESGKQISDMFKREFSLYMDSTIPAGQKYITSMLSATKLSQIAKGWSLVSTAEKKVDELKNWLGSKFGMRAKTGAVVQKLARARAVRNAAAILTVNSIYSASVDAKRKARSRAAKGEKKA